MKNLICGIDHGSEGVNKICLKSSFGKKELAETADKTENIIAIPAQFFTLRTFQFPFSDKKRLKQLIREELTDRLLFPLDNTYWDFISDHKGNAVAFVAPKERLDTFKADLSTDFKFLEPEPLCLLKAARWAGIKDALLIDMGAGKTIFLGIKDGFPDLLRILLKGGKELKTEMEKKTGFHGSEDLIFKQGLDNPEIKDFFAEILQSSLLPGQLPYSRIYLSGGVAQAPGIKEYLAKKYSSTVENLPLLEGLSPFKDAIAFGAALPGKSGEDSLEFFSQAKTQEWNPLYFWGGLALTILVLFSLNLKLEESNLKNQSQAYVNSVKTALKREFPQAKADTAPVSQFKALITQEIKQRLKVLNSPLDFISQLNSQLPGKGFKFYELNFADSQVDLKGYAPTYQKMEQLRQTLKGELVEGKTQPDGRVKFDIRLNKEKS